MLRPTRSWFSRQLNYEQRDAMKKLLHQHSDLLLITGNQYFLLLLAAMYKGGVSEPTTGLIESIWEYLEPWQPISFGFIPHYHAQHRTGKSVLHRTGLLKVLMNRVQATSKLLEKEHVSEVQFGRVILVTINKNASPTALWLVFQSEPASHEMNAFLIPISDSEDWDVVHLLKSLPREKPYWGKTDLSFLGVLTQDVDISYGIPIMIATHKRVRGLWVLGKKHWLPIGRITYYTLKKEIVTLLRSLTLRQDPTMQEIKRNHVRSFPSNLESSVEIAIGTIDAAFRHYQHATCKVSLDKEEKMFKLVFKNKDDSEAGYLLVKRVTNVLELLRRPDFECEPVEVNGNKFVWNRFKDIEYKGDALILRPWVERTDPFKIRSMKLPQTADTFLTVKRLSGLTLGIHHDPSLYPQARLTIKEIENRKQTEDKNSEAYMRKMEGEPGQPEQLLDESIHGHGSCWNISLKSSTSLPENLVELETIRFNGWALGAVLKTGMVIYKQDDEWILHEFDVPNVENLPREFRESVALVDAYRSIVPKALKDLEVPGTYRLRERELWNVTYTLEYGGLRWSARSLQTQQDYKGTSFSIFLHPEASLDHAYEQVISGITCNIPEESIFQYEELQENLKRDLREYGYRSGKEYELEVSRSDQAIEYEVWLHSSHEWETDGVLSVSESWKFEDIWQELMTSLIEKGLAEDEMMNKLDVQNKLHDLLTEIAPESGRGLVKEAKEKSHRKAQNLWNVYIEYSDLSEKYSTLMEEMRVDEALLIIEDILQLLTQESLEDDTTIRTYLVHTLAYKAKILTSDEKSGIVGPSTLLEILDRMYSYIQPDSRYLRSKSEFGNIVRWALALRDKLRADL